MASPTKRSTDVHLQVQKIQDLLDRHSLDEPEERSKQLLTELGTSTPDSSPDRVPATNSNEMGETGRY